MNLINLEISKIAIHQIFRRNNMAEKVDPVKGEELIRFDDLALSTFKDRVSSALGTDSKAVPMAIVDDGPTSLVKTVDLLLTANDSNFIDESFKIAHMLADAQNQVRYTGGIVVVFKGTYSMENKPFIGIMKADLHSAYEKKLDELTRQITLSFVTEALLTPATKLYKTAGFFKRSDVDESLPLKEQFEVLICDTQITPIDGKVAAQYFYSGFLGCGYPSSSAKTTKKFFDVTHNFIKSLEIDQERKSSLINALNSYLKYENTNTVDPIDFSTRYFQSDESASYVETLEAKKVQITSFAKDTLHIESKLKERKLEFKKKVKIIAPAKDFGELISFEEFQSDSKNEDSPTWTRVLIKDQITTQE